MTTGEEDNGPYMHQPAHPLAFVPSVEAQKGLYTAIPAAEKDHCSKDEQEAVKRHEERPKSLV